MADIITLQASDGSTIQFINDIKAAGGMKDVYFSPDKRYVVAFFRHKNDEQLNQDHLNFTNKLQKSSNLFKQTYLNYEKKALIKQQTQSSICNPNNPTGTYINKEEFDLLMQHVPSHVLVILDEAYFEFAQAREDYPNSMDYRYDNVITLRTFSKAYGLSGIRIGYGFGHEDLISNLTKVKVDKILLSDADFFPIPNIGEDFDEAYFQNLINNLSDEEKIKLTQKGQHIVLVGVPNKHGYAYIVFTYFVWSFYKSGLHLINFRLSLVQRAWREYLLNRSGQQEINQHIGIIGCGSLGSRVADFLVQMGVKEISLIDNDSFHLIRNYDSIEQRKESQDAFYSSAEWINGPEKQIMDCIESYNTSIIETELLTF